MKKDALADIALCVLVAAGTASDAFSRLVTELVAAGVRMLQIRDKVSDDATLIERVRVTMTIGQ